MGNRLDQLIVGGIAMDQPAEDQRVDESRSGELALQFDELDIPSGRLGGGCGHGLEGMSQLCYDRSEEALLARCGGWCYRSVPDRALFLRRLDAHGSHDRTPE